MRVAMWAAAIGCACTCVGSVGLAAQTGSTTMPITVQGVDAGSVVHVSMTAGQPVTPVTGKADGSGALNDVLDLGNLAKPHIEVKVYVGDRCPDKETRVELVSAGVDPSTIPDGCRKRLAGAFWLDQAQHVTLDAAKPGIAVGGGGISGKTKILIGAGTAAVIGVAVAAKGGGTTSTSGTSTTPITVDGVYNSNWLTATSSCIAAPVNGIPFTFAGSTLTISLWSGAFPVTITGSSTSASFTASFTATGHPPTFWAPCAGNPTGTVQGSLNATTGVGQGSIQLNFGGQAVTVAFQITGKSTS